MAGKRGSSAITGRFVKQSTVKRHPKTTTIEIAGKGGSRSSESAAGALAATDCRWREAVSEEPQSRTTRSEGPMAHLKQQFKDALSSIERATARPTRRKGTDWSAMR